MNVTHGTRSSATKLVLFLEGKDEPYTPTNGYSKWTKILVEVHHLEVKRCFFEGLDPDDLERTAFCVIAGPRAKFTPAEFDALKTFVNVGIGIWVLVGEGGEHELNTNVNAFLEPWGMKFSRDCVMRRMQSKYLHPKQALISDGLLPHSVLSTVHQKKPPENLTFLYPFGCTVDVSSSALPVVSSGRCCFPANRALCALALHGKTTGKILAFGSLFAFHDQFIANEQNEDLLTSLVELLLAPSEELLSRWPTFAEAGDIPERPHRQFLFPQKHLLKPVFDTEFFLEHEAPLLEFAGIDADLGAAFRVEAEILAVAKDLGVSWNPEDLTPPPELHGWLPRFKLPVMEPGLRLPGRPSLEFFELDEDLVADNVKIAKVLQKGTDKTEVLKEMAELFGMECRRNPEDILKHITQVVLRRSPDIPIPNTPASNVWINAAEPDDSLATPSDVFVVDDLPALKLDDILRLTDQLQSMPGEAELSDAEILQCSLSRMRRRVPVQEETTSIVVDHYRSTSSLTQDFATRSRY